MRRQLRDSVFVLVTVVKGGSRISSRRSSVHHFIFVTNRTLLPMRGQLLFTLASGGRPPFQLDQHRRITENEDQRNAHHCTTITALHQNAPGSAMH